MNKKLNVTVERQDPFVDEDIVFMNPQDVHDLRNGKNDEESWSLLIKVHANGKTIYRKVRGLNELKRNQVKLGYRSKSILGITANNNTATIKKTFWFPYNWCNFESQTKWPFRVSVIGIIVSIVLYFL